MIGILVIKSIKKFNYVWKDCNFWTRTEFLFQLNIRYTICKHINKGVFTTNQWMTIRKSKDDRKQHNHGSSVHYCFQYKSTLSTEKKALSLSFVLEQFEEHFPDSESNKIVMLERFHHYNNVGMFVLTSSKSVEISNFSTPTKLGSAILH